MSTAAPTPPAAFQPATTSATNFEELWQEIKTDAEKFWQTLEGDAVAVAKNIVPVVEAAVVTGLGQLKDLAIQTVTAFAGAEFDHLTGNDKHSQSVTTVFQTAEANGIAVGIADVQALIKNTYDVLAATKPAS